MTLSGTHRTRTQRRPSPTEAPRVVRYHTAQGQRIGLVCTDTPSEIRLVTIANAGVRIQRLPPPQRRYMTTLADYQPRRAAREFLRAGRRLGISRAAKKALRTVALAKVPETR